MKYLYTLKIFFCKKNINKIRFKNKNQFKCTYPVFLDPFRLHIRKGIYVCKCIYLFEKEININFTSGGFIDAKVI